MRSTSISRARQKAPGENMGTGRSRSSIGTVFGGLLGVLTLAAYVWSINQTAVQGYAVRSIEKEIADARTENQKLRIEEAELRSLDRIESAKDRLRLTDMPPGTPDVTYVDANGPLALR